MGDRTMVKRLVVIALLALTVDADAQTRFTVVGGPEEIVRDRADVSARAVVIGVVRRAAPELDGAADAIVADIPVDWAPGPVCLALLTQDGLYEYRSTYAPPPGWDGEQPVMLPFEPTTDVLARYPREEVALLAHRGACDVPEAPIAPASWPAAADDGGTIVELLINSFRADEVFLVVGTPPDVALAECAAVETGARVAFDFRCPLRIDSFHGPTPVQVMRLRNQTRDPRVEVDIVMP